MIFSDDANLQCWLGLFCKVFGWILNSVLICRIIQLQKKNAVCVCFFLLVIHILVFFQVTTIFKLEEVQLEWVTIKSLKQISLKNKNQFFTVIQKCIIILSLPTGRYLFLNHKSSPPCPVSLLKHSVCDS